MVIYGLDMMPANTAPFSYDASLANDPDFQVLILLGQASDALRRVWRSEFTRLGLTGAQAAALCMLNTSSMPMTPAEMSRRLMRKPHSVSALIGRMEKGGLVRKVKDLPRKNSVRIEATGLGQEVYQRAAALTGVQKVMSSVSKEQREELKINLRHLRDEALESAGVDWRYPFP